MARIIGNLDPEDDYLHELGPEPNFNESAYYNFFDTKQSFGGWFRIGNRRTRVRPSGRSASTCPMVACCSASVGPDRRQQRLRRGRSALRGRGTDRAPPHHLRGHRGRAGRAPARWPTRETPSRTIPKKKVQLRSRSRGRGPAVRPSKAETRPRSLEDAEKSFAKAHFEQHMHVTRAASAHRRTNPIDDRWLRAAGSLLGSPLLAGDPLL